MPFVSVMNENDMRDISNPIAFFYMSLSFIADMALWM